jgi:hypothetical protein
MRRSRPGRSPKSGIILRAFWRNVGVRRQIAAEANHDPAEMIHRLCERERQMPERMFKTARVLVPASVASERQTTHPGSPFRCFAHRLRRPVFDGRNTRLASTRHFGGHGNVSSCQPLCSSPSHEETKVKHANDQASAVENRPTNCHAPDTKTPKTGALEQAQRRQ